MASAHPPQGLPSGMDPSMMDEYASSPSCCKNSSRYPALARLGSSVPKMVWTVIDLLLYIHLPYPVLVHFKLLAGGRGLRRHPARGACFEPNMVSAHAAYAMNQLYQATDSHPWNCNFRQSSTLTSTNPSKPPILPWHLPSPLLAGPCITDRAAELVLCAAS
ncbi:hypothetical protein ZWY2020_031384 [Hordeum vulgare]|nr:hypothetical protein ZWY2020_031384 [Hordeum vulgare]